MATVLKFVCDGDIRRTRAATLSMEEIQRAAQQAFPELVHGGFDIKYRDDEDDACHLNSATFPDFATLYEGVGSVRLEVVKRLGSTGPAQAACAEASIGNASAGPSQAPPADASTGNADLPGFSTAFPQGAPPAISQFLQHVLSSLQNVRASQNSDALSALFVHFAPMLLQHISGHHEIVDTMAAQNAEAGRALVQALRDTLEPFPQMQEIQMSLDKMLQMQCLQGLGATTEAFLRTLTQLPPQEQRDIASVVVGGTLELILASGVASASAGVSHRGVVCDGCGARPITGPRFKCTVCPHYPGYDLCGDCYLRKDEIHPEHTFECKTQPDDRSAGSAWPVHCGWQEWGKGLGKGIGKGWGKGWGKNHGGRWWSKGWGKGCSSTASSDTSSSSDSEQSEHRASRSAAKASEGSSPESKQAMREARRACRKAVKEARKNFKAERKMAKKALKDAKKAQKEKLKCFKAEQKAMKHRHRMEEDSRMDATENTGAVAADFSFPVEVGDGRKLTISWNKSQSPEEVAAKFAEQHHIPFDEIPTIHGFIQHAMTVVEGASEAPPAPKEMDVSETAATAPTYAGSGDLEALVQTLEQMGFADRDLNMQMLVAHNGNLEKVLEQLL